MTDPVLCCHSGQVAEAKQIHCDVDMRAEEEVVEINGGRGA